MAGVTATQEQPLLPTDADTRDGETPYDVGHRHGLEGHPFFNDRIPKQQRRDYARGFTRGAAALARRNGEEASA